MLRQIIKQKESGILKTAGIILGVLTTILGIYAACVPFGTSQILIWVIAIMIIVNGIESVADGFSSYPKKNIGKIVLGVLVILAGAFIIFGKFMRLLTNMVFGFIIGALLIIYGVFQIVMGVQTRRVSKGAGWASIICGVISVIGGVLALGHPFFTMALVGYIIAFNLIMQGVNMIVIAVNRDRI